MNLVLSAVQARGNFLAERVQLDAIGTCDLGEFMLADTTYVGTHRVSNRVRHTHWFLDQPLSKGDRVMLHTRPGTQTKTLQSDGSVLHHVFWGLNRPVWNDAGDAAVLMQVAEWSAGRVG